jgi:hypothetical protein
MESKYERRRIARKNRRIWAISYLGGKCAECGYVEIPDKVDRKEKLEFDHIDPKTKSFTIGTNIDCRKEKLIVELNKCQLLCFRCHWIKTRHDRFGLMYEDEATLIPSCGTVNKYSNYACRCAKCREAWAKYFRPRKKIYRARKRHMKQSTLLASTK